MLIQFLALHPVPKFHCLKKDVILSVNLKVSVAIYGRVLKFRFIFFVKVIIFFHTFGKSVISMSSKKEKEGERKKLSEAEIKRLREAKNDKLIKQTIVTK